MVRNYVVCNFLFFLISCSAPLTPGLDNGALAKPTTSAGLKQQEHSQLMSNSISELMSTIEKYVDLDKLKSRSAAGYDTNINNVFDLLDKLPEDKLIRTLTANERSASGGKTQVTLREEAEKLAKKLQEEQARLAPDVSELAAIEGVSLLENGLLVIEDTVIDPRTPSGALAVELMKAGLRGEDPDKISHDLANLSIVSHDGNRAMFDIDTVGYAEDTVYWDFAILTSNRVKQAYYDAISDWETKTYGVIDFSQAPFSFGTYLGILFGSRNSTTLFEGPNFMLLGSSGMATIGAGVPWWASFVRVASGLSNSQLRKTTRHELGHTLGLHHEQQRPDRDLYLKDGPSVGTDGNNVDFITYFFNYRKFDYKGYKGRWESYRVTVRFLFWSWKETRYRWVVNYVDRNLAGGPFDLRSIMLYNKYNISSIPDYSNLHFDKTLFPNFKTGNDYAKELTAGEKVRYNEYISPLDAQGVINVYR